MLQDTVQLGQRGQLTIPSRIRKLVGLDEGSLLVVEVREDGILLRPAIATPVDTERYSALRKAEFLLNNATDREDYLAARREVEAMGVNPDEVAHEAPLR